MRVAWACLFCTSAAASHNLFMCHSQSRAAEKTQQAMEVQERVIGSQERVGKISQVLLIHSFFQVFLTRKVSLKLNLAHGSVTQDLHVRYRAACHNPSQQLSHPFLFQSSFTALCTLRQKTCHLEFTSNK